MMKILLGSLTAFALLVAPRLAAAKVTTMSFEVSGWSCAACSGKTADGLKKLDGVKEVKTDLKRKAAIVTFDDVKLSPKVIRDAIKATGFECDSGKTT